jgi:nicotinamidase-related amidase
MPSLTLDPRSTALVLIDLQQGIVAADTKPHAARDVVERATRLARRFRELHALVVLVHVDPGPNGVLFPRPQADQPRAPMAPNPEFATLVPELGPEPGDVVVLKHQPNAFYATDLEVHLARRGIRTIVLGGISTNLGVESTARSAHERGFEQVFVEDAMAARAPELHEFPVTKTFPTMGRVRSTADVLAALDAADGEGADPSPS